MNATQFNALAIVFLIGVLPFAVAFITNAGSSISGNYKNAHQSSSPPTTPNHWIENGGSNFTSHYNTTNPSIYYPYYTDCVYVTEGYCAGIFDQYQRLDFISGTVPEWLMPMSAIRVQQSHFWGDIYLGTSGDGPFSWYLGKDFFDAIEEGENIDKLRFTLVEDSTDYSCTSSTFENISFSGEITFLNNGASKTFANFDYTTDNKYELTYYDTGNAHWIDTCRVGFEVTFDFTGFESISLYDFYNGNFTNMTALLKLDNFQKENGLAIGTTALPMAGNDYFSLGIEYQPVDPVQAGFIIKSGTLFLSLATFAIAIASTPYWDPFRNFFKGMIQ